MELTTDQVLNRDMTTKLITATCLQLLHTHRSQLLDDDGPAYVQLFLGILRDIFKEETVEYVLALVDEMLTGLVEWLCAQLKKPSYPIRGIPTSINCLATLLKEPVVRSSFVQADGVKLLVSLISPASTQQSMQLLYETCLCVWLLSYYEPAIEYLATSRALPQLIEVIRSSSKEKAALYGLGVCVEFGGTVIKRLISVALSRLNVVIQHPDSRQPDNIMAYDNAVSALGKICQYHRDSIDAAQVIPAWLNCLPIKGDKIEAKVAHDQLCSMVERSDSDLLGPNNQFLSKIVQVFAEVLCAGKELATEQTASRMISLLKQLQQTLPPQTLASTWSSLQPQQQLALQSILSS